MIQNAVNNITISNERGGLGTEIVPAYKLINDNKATYLSNTKKNIIIVLADGAFNDNYKGNELKTLKINLKKIPFLYALHTVRNRLLQELFPDR